MGKYRQWYYSQMSLSLLFLVLLLKLISNLLMSLDRSLQERNGNQNLNRATLLKPLNKSRVTINSLKDELFSEHRVLSLPRVSPRHLHTVQRNVAVGVGEVFDGKFVGFLHIQD